VRALRAIMRQVAAGTMRALVPHLQDRKPVRRHDAKITAHGPTLNLLGITIQTHVRNETGKAFDKMAGLVSSKSKAGVKELVGIRQGVSVEPMIDVARAANIALMEKAGSAYIDQVRTVLEDSENEGLRVEDLAKLLAERADVSASRAELIARDQTLKLNSQLSGARMQNAGITSYTWSTSKDERVRPMHAELEGQEFKFGDPPVTNEAGDTNEPGQDYQCRCLALPVIVDFDEL
jgi:SPP1 gp7 family putative phage head morphogenesis protein